MALQTFQKVASLVDKLYIISESLASDPKDSQIYPVWPGSYFLTAPNLVQGVA